MRYPIGYLLLTLVIMCEDIKPAPCGGTTTTVRRRPWNDSRFDCCLTKFSINMLG